MLWLRDSVSAQVGLPAQQIDADRPLSQFGLESVAAVQLTAALEDWIADTFPALPHLAIPPTLAYDYPTIESIASHLSGLIEPDDSAVEGGHREAPRSTAVDEAGRSTDRCAVAVVGMSCRFPGAAGPEAFWRLLCNGDEAIERDLSRRENHDRGFGRAPAEAAGLLSDVQAFDAEFFGLNPREAEQMDPQQRLLMELSWEAFEQAGIQPRDWAGSTTGVFTGVSSNDYAHINAEPSSPGVYWGTGNAHSVSANRLSYFYDLRGPSMAVDTACSSSLVAVHLAVQSIQSGESDAAIAAGVNLLLSPVLTDTFRQAGMLAGDGTCKVFDADADGYVRGEGAGVLILRPLDQALRDNNTILGVISGTAINQDGRSNGLTAPNGLAQQAVVRTALARAGLDPSEISYLEAHGTGTSLGDPIEVNALGAVFQARPEESAPIRLGSVKANLGHLEAAAGIAGLIKVLLAMQHQAIPPQINLRQLNPLIQPAIGVFTIPTELTPWPGTSRHAGISSFGFGGTNAHVIVTAPEPAPEPPVAATDRADDGQSLPQHILKLSARSHGSLESLKQRLIQQLEAARGKATPDHEVASICYSANTTRQDHSLRLAASGSGLDGLITALERSEPASVPAGSGIELAFLFSGQGSQFPGMGHELLRCQPVFQEVIDACDAALAELEAELAALTGPGSEPGAATLAPAVLATVIGDPEGAGIDSPWLTQPALFAYEVALARLWQHWGLQPDCLLGHSVGEYAAACIAGVFSLKDGIRLVASRARLMAGLPSSGSMLAVLDTRERLESVLTRCGANLAVAVENGPQNTVLSGTTAEIERFQRAAGEAGLETRQLNVSHGFHSPLMQPMVDRFRAVAERVRFSHPQLPIVSSVSGERIGAEIATPEHWCRHILEPVRFSAGVSTLNQRGVSAYLEIGPRATLIKLGQSSLGRDDITWLASSRPGTPGMAQMFESLAALYRLGVDVDWPQLYGSAPPERVALPTYPWRKTHHWIAAPAQQVSDAADAVADLLYRVDWQAAPLNPGLDSAEPNPPGTWLLLADEAVHEAFVSTLPDGQSCIRLVHAPTCERVSRQHWRLNTGEVRDWERLLGETGRSGPVLGLLQAPAPAADEHIPSSGHEAFRVMQMARAVLQQREMQPPPRLWLISNTAAVRAAGRSPRFQDALLSGAWRTLALEQPRLWGGCITLPDLASPESHQLLQRELQHAGTRGASEVHIRHTDGRRLVPRLTAAAAHAQGPSTPSSRSRMESQPRLDGHVLISGGLGHLGLETAAWLIDEGVRALILIGRGDPGEAVARRLSAWRDQGIQINLVRGDIAERETSSAVESVLAESGLPLRGIVHAAGVLEDSLIADLTEDSWTSVIRPKAIGAWRLHELSLDHPVDQFLLFSSITSVIGSPGQVAYSAANAALDALAEYRHSQGLPAVSLSWGPWQGGGFADPSRHASARLPEQRGIRALPAQRYREVLSHLFHREASDGWHLAVCAIEMETLRRVVQRTAQEALLSDPAVGPARSRQGAAQLSDAPAPATASGTPGRDSTSPRDQLLQLEPQDRPDAIRVYLRGVIAAGLTIPPEQVGDHESLESIGADSLMVMDIISQLQRDLDLMIYPREFYEHPDLDSLSTHLARELDRLHGTSPAAAAGAIALSTSTGGTASLLPPLSLGDTRTSRRAARSAAPSPTLAPIIFILSSPRAGSTLLRVMLAGHSSLYSPPELHLLPFATMGERARKLSQTGMGEGLVRALMDLEGLSAEDTTRLVASWEEQDMPIEQVYARLQSSLGTRTLVDKSPTYALERSTLSRVGELFTDAHVIHLVRHPYAVIQSFVDLRMQHLFAVGDVDPYALAESVWTRSNLNVTSLQSAPGTPERVHRVRYETLVRDPGSELRSICSFLGFPFEASLLSPYDSGRLTDGVHGTSMSIGDPNFRKRQSIDPALADRWKQVRLPRPLESATAELAISLGYSLPNDPTSRQEPAASEPARESTLDVQGIRLGVCEWGPEDGPPVLCIHGILDQALVWEPIAGPLAEAGFHVIAVDLRGHGRSDHAGPGGTYQLTDFIRDAVGVVDTLALRDLTVIGHSLGSVVASTLTRLRSSVVRRLILVEPVLPGEPTERDVVQSVSSLVSSSLTPPQHEVMPDQDHARQRLRTALPSLAPQHAERLVARGTVSCQGGCIWSWDPVLRLRTTLNLQGGPLQREAYLDLLSGLEASTLAIHGSDSSFNRPEDLQAEQQALRHAEHVTLKGGHTLMIDAPAALSDCILSSLRSDANAPPRIEEPQPWR
ncbi:type I polyketide synthase [Synechococcus sp. RSCCF101]|uniref:type I polyketide synthase n=1 Tax=Synechococcus sp. RSCCF101 TaxID=2511069 RepID=UPI001CD993B0|nr:type I polyketide synthase [Synechococcus sp. RSCCF101]